LGKGLGNIEESYRKAYWILGIIIIIALVLLWFVPWLTTTAIANAFTLVNGLTASLSILVAFGGAINGIMFKDLTKDDKVFRSKYFEAIGFLIIPPVEALLAYIFLASGIPDYAIKTSVAGLLTAILVVLAFYLLIARKLKGEINKVESIEPKEKPAIAEKAKQPNKSENTKNVKNS
jgi:hypothetical protein